MTLNRAKNKVVDENKLKPAVLVDPIDSKDPESGDKDEEGFLGTAPDPEQIEQMDTQDRAASVGIKYEDGEELDINKKLQKQDQG